eukprot:15344341-Alexandrium_andersonii.AAC.1
MRTLQLCARLAEHKKGRAQHALQRLVIADDTKGTKQSGAEHGLEPHSSSCERPKPLCALRRPQVGAPSGSP